MTNHRRAAYEALESRGLVASKVHRSRLNTVVVLRIPDTDEFAEAILAYDPHYPGTCVAGWVRFRDPDTGHWVELDGKSRAQSWLLAAEKTFVLETHTEGYETTLYLDWRN